ncbi:MAG: hypothetical protein ACLFU6_08200, partial [Candidatus Hydrogenedentota bacterium]
TGYVADDIDIYDNIFRTPEEVSSDPVDFKDWERTLGTYQQMVMEEKEENPDFDGYHVNGEFDDDLAHRAFVESAYQQTRQNWDSDWDYHPVKILEYFREGFTDVNAVEDEDETAQDETAPSAGEVAEAPEFVGSGPISVEYAGAADEEDGTGLAHVELWRRHEGGDWQDSGVQSSGGSGTLVYEGELSEGTYEWYLVAEDNAGNRSRVPGSSDDGMASTTVDLTAPVVNSIDAPDVTNESPIAVSYSASDDGSGVAEARLWVKVGADGDWIQTSSADEASGEFAYDSVGGDGTYAFALQAVDGVGNASSDSFDEIAMEVVYDATAPEAAIVTAPEYASESSFTVTYDGASDGYSGVDVVELWAQREATGEWGLVDESSAAPDGGFTYSPGSDADIHHFATRVRDEAGNASPAPSGDGSAATIYDPVEPNPGAVTDAPDYTNEDAVTVAYGGAGGGLSGLKEVTLYQQVDGGSWTATDHVSAESSGSFTVDLLADGTYRFATRAESGAGVQSSEPVGEEGVRTVRDTQTPTASTVSAPERVDSPPIEVEYSGVSDAGPSGIEAVHLWVLYDGDDAGWRQTELSAEGESGSFLYDGMSGDGQYYFDIQADDHAGNKSAEPSGTGAASTVYDTSFTAGTASSPEYATETPITVDYEGAASADDELTVHLWVKRGGEGEWAETGLSSEGEAGSFDFTGVTGDDAAYYFAVQAEAGDGTRTTEPSGNGATNTIFDTTPPEPGELTATKEYANETPLVLEYEGAHDEGSGLNEVRLWAKKVNGGDWEDTGLAETGESGVFEYEPEEEGRFTFFLQAEDNAGHVSPEPTDERVFGAR